MYHKIIFDVSLFFCHFHTMNTNIFLYNTLSMLWILPQVTKVSFCVKKDVDICSDTNIKDAK